jgi:AmmeMemoRadiSam system protein A
MNEPDMKPPPATRAWLLALARQQLARSLGAHGADPGPRPADPLLDRPARVFVSWHAGEELVGCIGTLSAWPSLEGAVSRYAVAAGDDPRTPALRPERIPDLRCDISILSEPKPLDALGFDAIAEALRPGRDGVVLRGPNGRSAFFLPVVWESLPTPKAFLEALARKARIDLSSHRGELHGEVLEVTAFSDE